jgi:hypothetical protein
LLTYLSPPARTAFVDLADSLAGHWISNESPDVLPELVRHVGVPVDGPARFVLALDGNPLALAAAHGDALHWLTVRS